MKSCLLPIAAATVILSSCGTASEKSHYELVSPMVGTGFHGHTFPGATTPYGGVQLSPDTRAGNWDACSGYHYSDNTIDGFSHTHLNGTGCCDLGDVFVRPTSSSVDLSADILYSPSPFSHENESARPGYYSVKLDGEDIFAELTATPHVGVHRYTYPSSGEMNMIFDLTHSLTDETLKEWGIEVVDDVTIAGTRVTDAWTPDQHVYFVARFSRPFSEVKTVDDNKAAVIEFENDGNPLTMAVALSGVSRENALINLETEVPELNFDNVEAKTRAQWEDALNLISVEGGSPDQLVNFYSALYHTMISPNLMSDGNGEYRRHDNSIATSDGKYYSTFSLWDTYRAWHPLMTMINPDLVCDMINSMLDMYDATGELPIWPLASGETGCMIGRHAVSVIADAYLKGYRCFDAEKALEAMIVSSNTPRKGGDLFAAEGYIPCNSKRESVSCTLEYSYDDWCLARMAQAMGKDDIAREYYERAANYMNVYDGSTGFFRGRREDGNWSQPFNPQAVSRDMTEATSWQYRFGAQHDVNGMINLYGGCDKFAQAIDSIFYTTAAVEGDLSDVTGLIGQYAHGNEPSHHIAFLYNYVGQPWKTQAMTRRLLDEMYQPTPEGIIGNEDCGQMSAWYIMTALGLYPVAPGDNQLSLTTPLFEKAVIKLPNDTTLTIIANNPSKNIYIDAVELNGREIQENYVDFAELMKGGVLKFTLTDKPNIERGTTVEAFPYSMTTGEQVSVPYIAEDINMFDSDIDIAIGCATDGVNIYYTTDGSVPTVNSTLYTEPFKVDNTCFIKAIAFKEGYTPSNVMTMKATKTTYLPAVKPSGNINGVQYRYYHGLCEKTDDIQNGSLIKQGSISQPAIDLAEQEDHFAFIFDGYINIPEKGIYTFFTNTDDGSVLFIDGVKVVNNDGGHAAVTATGVIALEPGLHPFTLKYFEDYEGQDFNWGWKKPGAEKFENIPTENLYIK
ncbi:MAG: GH92 family glycosyl hydrolase [Clostridiales bacterium]|nr:GH92 family glycosyl hydrolase [Clostridiales bacterium]